MVARKLCVVAFLAMGCLAVAAEAQAQYAPYYQPPGSGPSPYMGLIGSGRFSGGMTQRYLTLVQPQLQARQAFQAQNAQIQTLSDDLRTATNQAYAGGAASGHVATFMNYSHYFPAYGGSTGMRTGQKLNKPNVASQYRR